MCAGTETDTGRNQSTEVGIWIHVTVMSELTSCEWGGEKKIIKNRILDDCDLLELWGNVQQEILSKLFKKK